VALNVNGIIRAIKKRLAVIMVKDYRVLVKSCKDNLALLNCGMNRFIEP